MMLEIRNLHYSHHDKPLLQGINLTLPPGGLLTILGPNGVGKSTLLNCIAGLLTPQQGQIMLQNKPLQALPPRQLARHIAYVSQSSPQTYRYSVLDYVVFGRAAHLGLFEQPGAADYALAEAALARLGITHLAEKTYMHTSGGEKQLANIAKILVQQPQLVLFDEPTAALDYSNVLQTLRLVRELSQEGFALIMTTHNPDHPILLHQHLPDSRVALLGRNGSLVSGHCADMLTEARLADLYQMDLKLVYVPELGRKVCTIHHI